VGKAAAVFLDRDGTINDEVGYLDRLDKLSIFPEAFDAIRRINQSGMKAVVISNQSGVARGYFDEAFVETVHERIQALLKEQGARIDRFYFCPHHPTEGIGIYRRACACRKPDAGLFLQAAQEMDIDLARSYMVGDMPKDIEAAGKAGVKGILVRTGYGGDPFRGLKNGTTVAQNSFPVQPDYIAGNILDAVTWIMRDRQP
jgi:D,D-heptose 1,7-bisphosphate phosphatase